MGTLYRITNKLTGEVIGDIVIDSNDAILLSSDYQLTSSEVLAQTLPDLKTLYVEEINKKAAQVRGRFITLERGQETTYARKTEEAVAYLQATSPVDTDYPYLFNEATATDTTVAALATIVIQRVQDLELINPIIEAQRKRGIKQVNEAIDEVSAKTERDGAITSLDAHVPV